MALPVRRGRGGASFPSSLTGGEEWKLDPSTPGSTAPGSFPVPGDRFRFQEVASACPHVGAGRDAAAHGGGDAGHVREAGKIVSRGGAGRGEKGTYAGEWGGWGPGAAALMARPTPRSIGENMQLLVDRPDGSYCFRLHKDRVYYVR